MKLLMVSGDRSILEGKRGAFFYTLEELSKHWDRIDVITPWTPAGESPFKKVKFHPCPHGLWNQPFWINKKGQELIAEHHHDVMTVHEYPPFYNGLGAKWLHKKTGIPYVSEIHHIVGWPEAASISERVGYWMSRFLLKWITSSAKAIRCVSNETQDVLKTWKIESDHDDHLLDPPCVRTSVIPSFYLDSTLLKQDTSIEKKYDVAFCARLVANKRLKDVINAIYLLPKVSLLVIGDGPERDSCEKEAHKLGIIDRVKFVGWLPTNQDVYRAMQSAEIFVVNSISEGGPRVAMEAMALGLPVVTTRVGIMNQFAGCVEFTDGSTTNLQIAIHKLLKDAPLRDQRSKQMQFVAQAWSREKMIKSYADFLKSFAK